MAMHVDRATVEKLLGRIRIARESSRIKLANLEENLRSVPFEGSQRDNFDKKFDAIVAPIRTALSDSASSHFSGVEDRLLAVIARIKAYEDT